MSEEKVKRGKPATHPIQWTVYIEKNLAAQVDLLFLNPVTGKTLYGYRNSLMNKLLREWLALQRDRNGA